MATKDVVRRTTIDFSLPYDFSQTERPSTLSVPDLTPEQAERLLREFWGAFPNIREYFESRKALPPQTYEGIVLRDPLPDLKTNSGMSPEKAAEVAGKVREMAKQHKIRMLLPRAPHDDKV